MTNSRRWMVALLVSLLGVPGAGLQGSGAGTDGHGSSGTGMVEAKDEKQGTVTIGGQVYGVSPSTRFVDAKGGLMPMKKLPVARVFRDEPMVDTDAVVNFEATETSRGWVLDYVRVLGELPR